MKKQQHIILNIYTVCSTPLYDVLDDISAEELNWKPGPDSRSISEMMRHLIRVDNWFLGRLEIDPESSDPGEVSADTLLAALKAVHRQIVNIITAADSTAALTRKSALPDAGDHETLIEIVIHMSQHYLYHLAQMIYLRRAQDREWQSPMKKWETATHLLAGQLAVVQQAFQED